MSSLSHLASVLFGINKPKAAMLPQIQGVARLAFVALNPSLIFYKAHNWPRSSQINKHLDGYALRVPVEATQNMRWI